MRWLWQRSSPDSGGDGGHPSARPGPVRDAPSSGPLSLVTRALFDPGSLLAVVALTSSLLGLSYVYRTRLRRVRNVDHLPPRLLHSSLPTHRRSLYGRIVTVPDGDGARFYHTPGGRWALWHLLRSVPSAPFRRSERGHAGHSFLAEQTLSVRLSGIDAPEAGHWGKPAQPFAVEAIDYLKSALLGRDARLYPHSKDQYGRVVGTILIRPWSGLGVGLPVSWQRDVGLELVQLGLATVYEARSNCEFGGKDREHLLREAQSRAQKSRRGMWALDGQQSSHGRSQSSSKPGLLRRLLSLAMGRTAQDKSVRLETPREFKKRMSKDADNEQKHGS